MIKKLLIKELVRASLLLSIFVFFVFSSSGQQKRFDCGGIGGKIRFEEVQIPQQGGGTLNAKVFAPDAAKQTSPCPGISMLPGGGAQINSVEWAAERLAANGYVVIITKPERGGSTESYNTAAKSGIDFLFSDANPYLKNTNVKLIGAAGYSLSARSLAKTQEEDNRLSAVVGWDNFAVSETGDAGSPACRNEPGTLRTPRVPFLAQASETCQDGRDADVKKTAFNRWRESGKPAMQVVFKGATHFFWSARAGTNSTWNLAGYYTQAWFDRWLKNDASATKRLLAREINGKSVEDILSPTFRSAVFLDGNDCSDFRAGCGGQSKNKQKGSKH